MKLQSYSIYNNLLDGDVDSAIDSLFDYFNLPKRQGSIATTTIDSFTENRILVWCGDFYFEWSELTGFDKGMHNYPIGAEPSPSAPDSIIIWKRK